MRGSGSHARAWLLCSLLFACSENPSTGMLVSIHADELVALHLNRVQVQLYAAEQLNESKPVEDRPFYLAAAEQEQGEVTFPFSFVILKGKAQRFRLVVKGYRPGSSEPVIEQKVIASFRDGQTELLRILLGDVCYDVPEPCLALDRTCSLESGSVAAGSCGPVPVAATERLIEGAELDAAISWPEPGGLDAEADREPEAEFEAGSEYEAGEERDSHGQPDSETSRDAGEPARDAGNERGSELADGSVQHDHCAPNPCQHGGRCSDGGSCICADTGFDGPTCATNVNECSGANACAGMRNGIAFSYPCLDHTGENVGYACPGMFPDRPLVDPPARFAESPSGVMRDAKTDLSWQRVLETVDRSFADARSYCANLPLAGGGFRLPTRAELDSITDLTVREPSAIDQLAFPSTPGTWFWTSSPYIGSAGSHWVVHFYNGSFYYQGPTFAGARVRCVR